MEKWKIYQKEDFSFSNLFLGYAGDQQRSFMRINARTKTHIRSKDHAKAYGDVVMSFVAALAWVRLWFGKLFSAEEPQESDAERRVRHD